MAGLGGPPDESEGRLAGFDHVHANDPATPERDDGGRARAANLDSTGATPGHVPLHDDDRITHLDHLEHLDVEALAERTEELCEPTLNGFGAEEGSRLHGCVGCDSEHDVGVVKAEPHRRVSGVERVIRSSK